MPNLITPASSSSGAKSTYESNPFLNAAAGLRAILQYNPAVAMLSGLVVVAVVIALYVVMFGSFATASGWGIAFGIIVYLLGLLLLVPYALGLYVIFAVKSGRGQSVSMAQASSLAWSKLWPMLGLYIVVYLGTTTGMLLLVVPGLIFLARTLLAPFYMLDENIGPIAAIDRSFRATKGHTIEMMGSMFAGMLMGGGYLLAPAVGMAPLLGRYQEIRQMEQSGAKKPKTHWLNYAAVFGGFLIIGLIVVLYVFIIFNAVDQATHQIDQGLTSGQTQAIMQAQNYHPPTGIMCSDIVTPARDQATGAKYTFPNGCLPPGWVAEP